MNSMDLSLYTLLPGLVNSHAHLAISGTENLERRRRQLRASFQDAKEVITAHLMEQARFGVVALRDGGDYAGHALRYREACLDRIPGRIVLKTAGRAWHAPGRYGKLVGRTPLKGHSLAQSIVTRHEGIDHVKIVNSGLNSLSNFGEETLPQFTEEELDEAVRAARSVGLKTMVHANGKLPVRLAVEAGCDSIEHGYFMGRENLIRIAEKGITWVPTAFTMEAYSRVLDPGSLEAETAKRNLDHQLEQIRLAEESGVPMAAGTDAGSLGVDHGRALGEEIRLFMVAGLSPERAIRCATSQGAHLLGLEQGTGRLSVGSPATFLATEGSPENLPDALLSPKRVFVSGEEMIIAGERRK